MLLKLTRPMYPPDDPQRRGPTYGQDVVAVKFATSRAGWWRWQEFDPEYSNAFAHGGSSGGGVERMQMKAGIAPTGYVGSDTFNYLQEFIIPKGLPHAGEHAFNEHARDLYTQFILATPAEKIIASFWKWADWYVAHEPQIHYSWTRPISFVNPPPIPEWRDCSSTVLNLAWLSGARSPDPVFGYAGYGNTDSLIQGGYEIHLDDVPTLVKDHIVLAFYGYAARQDPSHVTAVKTPTKVFSNGREAGPEWRNKIAYRTDYFMIRAYSVV